VKVVVWDLDETLWDGTWLELPAVPEPRREAIDLARELSARGVLNCVATRNPPSQATELEAEPWFAESFVDAEVGWGPKADSIRALADRLDLGIDTFVYVDQDPFERAQIENALPEVRALDLDELRAELDASAPAATPEARRRTALYRQRRERAHAEAEFTGTCEEFLRSCELRVSIAEAAAEDADRLAELMQRTRQYNSSGAEWPLDEVRARIGDPGWLVATVRLSDRFGDYGLVGAAFVDRGEGVVHSLTISCRAAGRGVLDALIGWLAQQVGSLRIPVRPNERNVPLRLGLRALGLSRTGETFHVDPAAAPA
jgi:methoxymalonate biosynthesis protein